MSFWNKTYSVSFIRIKSRYAFNEEAKRYHGNIMILQTFAKDIRHQINCETDGGLVCFGLDPYHNFVT